MKVASSEEPTEFQQKGTDGREVGLERPRKRKMAKEHVERAVFLWIIL